MMKLNRIALAIAIAATSLTSAGPSAYALGLKEIKCAAKCKSRSGFGACLATCVATKQVCDSGYRNCSRL